MVKPVTGLALASFEWIQPRSAKKASIEPKAMLFMGAKPQGDQFIRTTPAAVIPLRFGEATTAPSYGVTLTDKSTQFSVWAPRAKTVELLKLRRLSTPERDNAKRFETLEDERRQLSFAVTMAKRTNTYSDQAFSQQEARIKAIESEKVRIKTQLPDILRDRVIARHTLTSNGQGTFSLTATDFKPNDLYMYRLIRDDSSISKPLPDMRSRFQPEDVHGPSQVIANDFQWGDQDWKTHTNVRDLSIYRFHTGTFTKEGTLNAASNKLDYIKGLGYNAVEVMPIKEFPGQRNWGYDMADFFAVENSYGTPNDFKNFVNEAHKKGLAVILDVVYNHVGPEGSYFSEYDRNFTAPGSGGWGDTLNYHNSKALDYARDNIEMWLKEFHVDGFRFDMTKYIDDRFAKALTWHARQIKPDVLLFAEDGRDTDPRIVDQPHDWGGNGFNGQWSFGAHHILNSIAAGQSHMGAPTHVGGLEDYLNRGTWLPPNYFMREPAQNVIFTMSHDETGNNSGVRPIAKYGIQKSRLVSALKYFMPGIPMNFMGEEYAEMNPFNKFFDHNDPVLVEAMDREYYGNEAGYRTHHNRLFPQPLYTSPESFERSKLSWNLNQGFTDLTKDSLRLRSTISALRNGTNSFNGTFQRDRHGMNVWSNPSDVLYMHRWDPESPQSQVLVIANFSGIDYKKGTNGYNIDLPPGQWTEVLNSDNKRYGGNGLLNTGDVIDQAHGKPPINLPGHSFVVLKKMQPVPTASAN